MTVFFTSDPHLSHRAMAWMRKYGEWPKDRSLITPELVTWHDDMLAQRWDAVVRPDDTVWLLGDLTANSKHVPTALDWIRARPGRKHFVYGNHDPGHPMHSDSQKWDDKYRTAFATVGVARKRTIPLPDGGHQLVLLSHFPYTGDGSGEDRCSQWRLPNGGYAVLHGHVHSEEKVTYAPPPGVVGDWVFKDDAGAGEVMQVHVGVDAWDYTPVAMEQIGELLV